MPDSLPKLRENAADIRRYEPAITALYAERRDLVAAARQEGVPWADIETATGVTRQTLVR